MAVTATSGAFPGQKAFGLGLNSSNDEVDPTGYQSGSLANTNSVKRVGGVAGGRVSVPGIPAEFQNPKSQFA